METFTGGDGGMIDSERRVTELVRSRNWISIITNRGNWVTFNSQTAASWPVSSDRIFLQELGKVGPDGAKGSLSGASWPVSRIERILTRTGEVGAVRAMGKEVKLLGLNGRLDMM